MAWLLPAIPLIGQGVSAILGGIFGRRAKRQQRNLEDARRQAAINEIHRQREGYLEQSELAKQNFSQNAFSRGIGQSTMMESGLGRMARARQRALASFGERENLAQAGYDAFKSAQKYSDIMDWVGLGTNVLGAAFGTMGAAGLFNSSTASNAAGIAGRAVGRYGGVGAIPGRNMSMNINYAGGG